MNADRNMSSMIIQPLPVDFECYDLHVMLYMEGHKDYESIEAMISENSSSEPLIRVIATLHGGMQVDHINNATLVERLKLEKKMNRVFFTQLKYSKQIKKGSVQVHLEFKSYHGEEIQFHLCSAGKASPFRAGLINPGGHSRQLSLPVMFPEKTTLAGKGSYIKIDGLQYKIPVIINIPLLFKGYKGYYSEQFNLGAIRAGTRNTDIISFPSNLAAGQEWIYESRGKRERYQIFSYRNTELTIHGTRCIITADTLGAAINLKNIAFYSSPMAGVQSTQSEFSIAFFPSIPTCCLNGKKPVNKCKFSISINNHKELITGIASISTANDCFLINMIPEKPDWAIERQVNITLKEQTTGQFSIKTKISKRPCH